MKIKKAKLLALVLTLTMALALLAACSEGSSSDTPASSTASTVSTTAGAKQTDATTGEQPGNSETTSGVPVIPGLSVEIFDIQDKSNIIVYVEPHTCIGFELANEGIVVKNEAGEPQKMIHAASAFLELGGGPENLSTFRIEFEKDLAPGKYTLTLDNFFDDSKGTNRYEPASVDFTIE